MDRAYSGKKKRELAFKLGYIPVVSPKKNFKEQWDFTRYDKLDVVYEGFILFAMVIDSLV